MTRNEIGLRELRRDLGDVVTAAQYGTTTVITRNGKPIAMLVPYAQEPAMQHYTAAVPASVASWLCSPEGINGLNAGTRAARDLGDGRVELDADTVEAMRELPEEYDGHVDADGYLWSAGDGYLLVAEQEA